MALKSYGDVDVLAWRADPPRVLLIECKNLRESKTVREIAEQLADFRGELDNKGKPDHLLRHIRRVEKIKGFTDRVQSYLALNETPRIEGHVVFRNPVPMKFAWEQMAQRIPLSVFSELDRI
jgi:trehalose-6-phosphate synthase